MAEADVTLRAVLEELTDLRSKIEVVREAVIRMETHGYGVQIEELRRDARDTREKVIVIETKGRMAAGVIAAAVSIAVMVVGSAILYAMNIPLHVG